LTSIEYKSGIRHIFSFKKEVYSSTGIKIGSYKTPEFKEVNYILSSKKSI